MKVLHSIDQLKMGGAQTHLLTILKELKVQHPTDTHVVMNLFGENEFKETTDELKIEVINLHLETYFNQKKIYSAYKIVKEQIKFLNPDVVETHLTWSRLLVNTAAFRLGIKNRIGFEQGDIFMDSLKMRVANFLSQFIFKKIIVCSDELKTWVVKTHKINPSKIQVMYNCVDLSKFQPVYKKNAPQYLNFENELPEFTFITVGSMGEGVNKRMDISIRAVANLKNKKIDAGLIICGDGKNRNNLENLAKELGISDSVYFLGNRKDVHKIMPHCYAYLHSAPYEPFGIVCIEAMASGLPVILPNTGGIQRIIKDGSQGYIYKALDYENLAKKSNLLITSNNYDLFSMSALKKVQDYSVENYVSELYKFYE